MTKYEMFSCLLFWATFIYYQTEYLKESFQKQEGTEEKTHYMIQYLSIAGVELINI